MLLDIRQSHTPDIIYRCTRTYHPCIILETRLEFLWRGQEFRSFVCSITYSISSNDKGCDFLKEVMFTIEHTHACRACHLMHGKSKKIHIKRLHIHMLMSVSYTHLRAHETKANLVCRLLLEKKKK